MLVNIHGPNRDDPNFFANLNEKIAKLGIPNLVLAGDWNLVLDPTLDYCNYKRQNNVKALEKVEEIIADYCLVDSWRELNPQIQFFTWRQTNLLQQSRLDFFYFLKTSVTL